MDEEIKSFKNFVDDELVKLFLIPKMNKIEIGTTKDAGLSTETRREGNALYVSKNHDSLKQEMIFKLYNKSVALAPTGSVELALAYGNRSAFLFSVKKYKACLHDINMALNLTQSESLKEKLLIRRTKCLTNLNVSSGVSIDKVEDNMHESTRTIPQSMEVSDILESVDISYTEKYGRHLLAKKNFNPGDIIFVEKLYASFLHPQKFYTHCSHCLSFCWSGIPCENCSCSLFCSEECKKEAMEKYHDIECPIIAYLYNSKVGDETKIYLDIRTLAKGLKEFGSIDKLRDEIKSVDECKDKCLRGFKNKGKFLKKWLNLYSFSNVQQKGFVHHIKLLSMSILALIAKFTTVLGKRFESIDLEDLTNNLDIIFLGSLIIKILKMHRINAYNLQRFSEECCYGRDHETCDQSDCCVKGFCVSSVASLVNHNCNPNVSRCFTEDNKIIIFAVYPIEKDSQIFDCYTSDFYSKSKSFRRDSLHHYEFVCDCMACKHDWAPIEITDQDFVDSIEAFQMDSLELRVYTEYFLTFTNPSRELKFGYDEVSWVLSRMIRKVFKTGERPSQQLLILIDALRFYFSKRYGYQVRSGLAWKR